MAVMVGDGDEVVLCRDCLATSGVGARHARLVCSRTGCGDDPSFLVVTSRWGGRDALLCTEHFYGLEHESIVVLPVPDLIPATTGGPGR